MGVDRWWALMGRLSSSVIDLHGNLPTSHGGFKKLGSSRNSSELMGYVPATPVWLPGSRVWGERRWAPGDDRMLTVCSAYVNHMLTACYTSSPNNLWLKKNGATVAILAKSRQQESWPPKCHRKCSTQVPGKQLAGYLEAREAWKLAVLPSHRI